MAYIMGALYQAQAEREAEPTVPPDPTRRELVWGKAYPCLRYALRQTMHNHQCGGMMQPAKRCFRYEGVLWRKFKCDRCGREATDKKEQDA